MAHIKELTDKPRTRPWRAQVRGDRKVTVKMFKSRAEAKFWADEQERAIRLTGLPLTMAELKKHTVGDLVRRYLVEKTPDKGCRVSETTVLNKFLRHPTCRRSLASFSRKDAHDYIKERLKEKRNGKPIKPSTVARERNSIQHIFEVARDEWGFSNLPNHFRGIKIKGSMWRSKRRLHEGELERLLKGCHECRGLNEYYVPLATYLTIETGMRLDEIFNLKWADIDFAKRTIEIRKSKTDQATGISGRTIVLPVYSMLFLSRLEDMLSEAGLFKSIDKILPMTKGAFQQSWTDARKRAGIVGLTFRDLRREAASRFEEADLGTAQIAVMMGHKVKDMTTSYITPRLKLIQDKLDRYCLGGQTLEEATGPNGIGGMDFSETQSGARSYQLPNIIPLLKKTAA